MGRKKQSLTSTQIGTIAENLVANELMIESRGRLLYWPRERVRHLIGYGL